MRLDTWDETKKLGYHTSRSFLKKRRDPNLYPMEDGLHRIRKVLDFLILLSNVHFTGICLLFLPTVYKRHCKALSRSRANVQELSHGRHDTTYSVGLEGDGVSLTNQSLGHVDPEKKLVVQDLFFVFCYCSGGRDLYWETERTQRTNVK